ncbi:MAG: Phosphoadenosine phosphosulfate reductase family [Gemmatimonadetes bacterium]|nr:Phosphoadenosine phosphosulfate reductase family [Gemmatimonadota bacterium]
MPSLAQMRAAHTETAMSRVRSLAALSRTAAFRRKFDFALRTVAAWRAVVTRPAVACGGGKDSSALLLVTLAVDGGIPIYRADPPNPLPDRLAYVGLLARAVSSEWRAVPYPWDVESVLAGRTRYPAMLKVRTMEAQMREDGVDGLALGVRATESVGRRANYRVRGACYRRADGMRICTPLIHWTADEVVGFLLAKDQIPLNPVYTKLELAPPLEYLRDGTWYPRELSDGRGYRDWLGRHYPDVAPLYDAACRIHASARAHSSEAAI